MKTYCNPLNLSYRFVLAPDGRPVEAHREAADPSVILYRDRYWLFASKSGGYWWSDDLHDWTFVPTAKLPTEDYAPDVRVIDGAVYCTASRRESPCPIFRTTDPAADDWEEVSAPFPFWDPNLFQDDDGRVYLYYGCSNREPIYGVELDRDAMTPKGEPVPLFGGAHDRHGWERGGEENAAGDAPWVEGAWMTKHDGVYYLQYAAPGTEWNVYADGVYTARAPLGPYTYAAHNPFSLKPGGFLPGAGHGSTFRDKHGNLWHASTMQISVKAKFERRIGLWPAGFDADGHLFCNTRFGDWPTRLPDGPWDPWADPFAGWFLLSYAKPATASSSLPEHAPALAVDEWARDYWAAEGAEGEWFAVDLGGVCRVHAVQIDFAEHGCDCRGRDPEAAHRYLLETSADGETWEPFADKRESTDDTPHDFVARADGVAAQHVRITCRAMPGGGVFALSGLRVFGAGSGPAPGRTSPAEAARLADDPLAARVRWPAAANAVGYNVLWGIAPEKLYTCRQVLDATQLTIRSLDAGTDYWVRIDAFGETGVTPGPVIPIT